jgi:hypothetical protein
MAETEISLNANRLMKQITMKVRLKGVKKLLLRVKVGIFIIKIATWIMGCDVEIENP